MTRPLEPPKPTIEQARGIIEQLRRAADQYEKSINELEDEHDPRQFYPILDDITDMVLIAVEMMSKLRNKLHDKYRYEFDYD